MELLVDAEEEEGVIRHGDMSFEVTHDPKERRVYVFDYTEFHQLQVKHRNRQLVFLHVQLDNIDEATQGLDDQQSTLLINDVSSAIDQWGRELGIYLRRTSAEKFFGVLTEQQLRKLEENRFDILDTVRERTSQNKIPVTLSIGVGAGAEDLLELGKYAQSSLDIALGRGGDQAAVKKDTGRITFYGGKSNAVEKRTRVRARVISHALRDLIQGSSRVFVMGHRGPDMDSVGSAIGVVKAAEAHDRQAYIVMDLDEDVSGVERLLEHIRSDEQLRETFITPAKALEMVVDKSLLVIVDVHKPSMVVEGRLIDSIQSRVVIDHHRRGEEFIPDPLLVYMEPYASSTSELVTELLEYQGQRVQMSKLEATAMLAGIVVDTKSFAFRTGTRTFDAASYLRHHGADTSLVQKLLKDDLERFIQRANLVANAQFYRQQIAISIAPPDQYYSQVLLAQAADTLLTINDVSASFVISLREDDRVSISARSLGDLNVQVMMEKMGGGGHLTNAATQIEGKSIEEVLNWLKQVVDEYIEGGDQS